MMLLSKKLDRALLRGRRPEATQTAPTPEMLVAASAIGENYEVLHSGLDRLSIMAEQLRSLEPLLLEMRQPLNAEFEAHRDQYVELIALRAATSETTVRLETLGRESHDLRAALEEAEAHREELLVLTAEHELQVQERRLEIDRLRTELSQAESRSEELAAAERDSAERVRRQDEDLEVLRLRIAEAEAARTEMATRKSRAERDVALLTDEKEALKKRSEELAVGIAQLVRTEASLESQLSTERARAAGDQIESSGTIRALQTQLEVVRAEAATHHVRLDTLTARAERLEMLNSALGSDLAEAQTARHCFEREASHLQIELKRASDRIQELETLADETRLRTAATEAARLAAVDRAAQAASAAAAHEKALARSEDRFGKLKSILSALKLESEGRVKVLEDHVTSIRSNLEGAKAESAMTAAALNAARRERAFQEPASVPVAVTL